ncbi:MAG: hypothetical protein HQL69_16415 [Magnetococcales bacterium]|nr:hypothetical protein [Magnetococcales bacterium]
MNYSIKELIERACAFSIESAELANIISSSGDKDLESEKKLFACKQKYAESLEVLRLADQNGFEHNKAKVVEITRMAMQR